VKKYMFVGIGAVGAAAASMALCGSGVASADNEYAGQTYAEAQRQIGESGGTATINTVVGDQLPTDQCRVSGSREGNYLDAVGTNVGGEVLLDLNCNADVASAGSPGNSLASPEGQQARQDQLAQQGAESQQNESDELLQSGEVTGAP